MKFRGSKPFAIGATVLALSVELACSNPVRMKTDAVSAPELAPAAQAKDVTVMIGTPSETSHNQPLVAGDGHFERDSRTAERQDDVHYKVGEKFTLPDTLPEKLEISLVLPPSFGQKRDGVVRLPKLVQVIDVLDAKGNLVESSRPQKNQQNNQASGSKAPYIPSLQAPVGHAFNAAALNHSIVVFEKQAMNVEHANHQFESVSSVAIPATDIQNTVVTSIVRGIDDALESGGVDTTQFMLRVELREEKSDQLLLSAEIPVRRPPSQVLAYPVDLKEWQRAADSGLHSRDLLEIENNGSGKTYRLYQVLQVSNRSTDGITLLLPGEIDGATLVLISHEQAIAEKHVDPDKLDCGYKLQTNDFNNELSTDVRILPLTESAALNPTEAFAEHYTVALDAGQSKYIGVYAAGKTAESIIAGAPTPKTISLTESCTLRCDALPFASTLLKSDSDKRYDTKQGILSGSYFENAQKYDNVCWEKGKFEDLIFPKITHREDLDIRYGDYRGSCMSVTDLCNRCLSDADSQDCRMCYKAELGLVHEFKASALKQYRCSKGHDENGAGISAWDVVQNKKNVTLGQSFDPEALLTLRDADGDMLMSYTDFYNDEPRKFPLKVLFTQDQMPIPLRSGI